jgi:hypothetical protein
MTGRCHMRREMLPGLASRILLVTLLVVLVGGCAAGPFGHTKVSNLQVTTDPGNAIVYLKQRMDRQQSDPASPLPIKGEYWAVGTTPYRGDIDPGFWDMRIEAPGFEPIDILVRAEPGKVHIYEFQMQSTRVASR